MNKITEIFKTLFFILSTIVLIVLLIVTGIIYMFVHTLLGTVIVLLFSLVNINGDYTNYFNRLKQIVKSNMILSFHKLLEDMTNNNE